MYSDEIKITMFEEAGLDDPVFKYGTYAASYMLEWDTLYTSFSKGTNATLIMLVNYERWSMLQQAIKFRLVDIDADTKGFIENQLDYIMYITVIYIIVSIALYFGVYLPHIIREKSKIRKLLDIINLIPSVNTIKL